MVWLWLWCRLATAALIPPLAWETPDAKGVALKKKKKKKKAGRDSNPGPRINTIQLPSAQDALERDRSQLHEKYKEGDAPTSE